MKKVVRKTKPIDGWGVAALGLVGYSVYWIWTSPTFVHWCISKVGADGGPPLSRFIRYFWTMCAAIILWRGLTRPNVTEEIIEERYIE